MLFTLVMALERGCLEAVFLLAFVLALNNICNEAEAVSNGFGTAKTSENLQRFQRFIPSGYNMVKEALSKFH